MCLAEGKNNRKHHKKYANSTHKFHKCLKYHYAYISISSFSSFFNTNSLHFASAKEKKEGNQH